MRRMVIISVLLLGGCAAQKETISVEKKKGVMVIHHRSHTSYGTRDRIEAINSKGVVTQAEVKVYDVGRLPDNHGGMREASRYYQIVKSPSFDLRLPEKSSTKASGPKTVFTPPNYSPPPADERINDAIADANDAKEKLNEKQRVLASRIDKDNVLRGQLQDQISADQQVINQLKAAFNTEKKEAAPSEAQKAAEDGLSEWGKQVGN